MWPRPSSDGRGRTRSHFLLRDGLIRLLGAHGHDVVAAVDNGAELLRALGRERPDVAVVDVRLPPDVTDEGLRAVLAAREENPDLPVLLLFTKLGLLPADADNRRVPAVLAYLGR